MHNGPTRSVCSLPPPNSGLPEFGSLEWPKSDISDFGGGGGLGRGVSKARRAAAFLAFIASMLLTATASAADDDFAYGRRLYLDKAQCAYCHGWAADGA